jgi:hypothetical protein
MSHTKDPFRRRSEDLQAKRPHEKRKLVCLACVTGEDFVFGGVHSDRACARCGKEPLGEGAVVASSPWAGGIAFG